MVFTIAVLVGLAALALARGVSVLAEDPGTGAGEPRQTVQAPAVQATPPAQDVRAGEPASVSAGDGPQTIAPTPQAPGSITHHTVESGETLGKIALKYRVTSAAIANANGITNPDMIRLGQRLIIPTH
jgi:LysM repeat protein